MGIVELVLSRNLQKSSTSTWYAFGLECLTDSVLAARVTSKLAEEASVKKPGA